MALLYGDRYISWERRLRWVEHFVSFLLAILSWNENLLFILAGSESSNFSLLVPRRKGQGLQHLLHQEDLLLRQTWDQRFLATQIFTSYRGLSLMQGEFNKLKRIDPLSFSCPERKGMAYMQKLQHQRAGIHNKTFSNIA